MFRFSKFSVVVFMFLFQAFGFQAQAQVQVNADLELRVLYPTNQLVVPFGDSVQIQLLLINHGPDDIISDTLLLSNSLSPHGAGYLGDILVGDSGIAIAGLQYSSQADNDTIDICYFFQNPVSISNRVHDSNPTNDTACVRYIMLGANSVSVPALEAGKDFRIYPNPASKTATVSLNQKDAKSVQLKITDVLGKQYYFRSFSSGAPQKLELDIAHFSSGWYFISIIIDGVQITKKLLVEN